MDIYDVAQDATQIATATNKSDYWYIYPVGINVVKTLCRLFVYCPAWLQEYLFLDRYIFLLIRFFSHLFI